MCTGRKVAASEHRTRRVRCVTVTLTSCAYMCDQSTAKIALENILQSCGITNDTTKPKNWNSKTGKIS